MLNDSSAVTFCDHSTTSSLHRAPHRESNHNDDVLQFVLILGGTGHQRREPRLGTRWRSDPQEVQSADAGRENQLVGHPARSEQPGAYTEDCKPPRCGEASGWVKSEVQWGGGRGQRVCAVSHGRGASCTPRVVLGNCHRNGADSVSTKDSA